MSGFLKNLKVVTVFRWRLKLRVFQCNGVYFYYARVFYCFYEEGDEIVVQGVIFSFNKMLVS